MSAFGPGGVQPSRLHRIAIPPQVMSLVLLQFLLFSTWAGWYHPPIDVSRYAPVELVAAERRHARPLQPRRLRVTSRAIRAAIATTVLGVLSLCGLTSPTQAAEGKTVAGAANIASATNPPSRVVIAYNAQATEAFKPRPDVVRELASMALTNLVQTSSTRAAWKSLIGTNDIVGLKVHSAPGADSGTRPAVVAALIEQLLDFGLPPSRIIIWDRQRADLRRAGFYELAEKYAVRVEGSVNAGFDPNTYYDPDQPVVGPLIWSDLEFGKTGTGVGRRSHVSKLLQEMTRIVIVTPMLNHNTAGVIGHLYSLALGSVDNTMRFENEFLHLKSAVPELFALPALGDRVVLCVTDALICQYEGEERGLLHYSAPLNQLRFSRDPVALDLLSLRELQRQRTLSTQPVPQHPSPASLQELFDNAALLELGHADDAKIRIEYVPRPAAN